MLYLNYLILCEPHDFILLYLYLYMHLLGLFHSLIHIFSNHQIEFYGINKLFGMCFTYLSMYKNTLLIRL